MTRIDGRTSFARTPEEVFDFLADPRHEPAYNPRVLAGVRDFVDTRPLVALRPAGPSGRANGGAGSVRPPAGR